MKLALFAALAATRNCPAAQVFPVEAVKLFAPVAMAREVVLVPANDAADAAAFAACVVAMPACVVAVPAWVVATPAWVVAMPACVVAVAALAAAAVALAPAADPLS